MLPILQRYFLRRWSSPFLGALFLYGGLILAWEMIVISKEIFSMGAPFRWLAPYLLAQVPETMGIVLPMAAVLGGLLGSQQLSESSEMVASQGLGIGTRSFLRPWAILAAILVVLSALNAHLFVPKINTIQHSIRTQMLDEAQTRFLKPGNPPFFPPNNANNAIWIDASGEIHFMESNAQGVQHLVAQSMEWARVERHGQLTSINLEFQDLNGCLVRKENGSIVHIKQKTFNFAIPIPPPSGSVLPPTPLRYLSTAKLFTDPSLPARVELGRRFSLPIAACALLLLGIALGMGHPRFQHGGAIVKSLGVILVYYMLMKSFENIVLGGKPKIMYAILGLPWGFLTVGFALLWRRLRPHRSAPSFLRRGFARVLRWGRETAASAFHKTLPHFARILPHPVLFFERLARGSREGGTLARWTRDLWWRNWGAAMGCFLTLSLLLEYASLAGDLAKNRISLFVFFQYWVWNLPPFLVVVLPIAFLFAGVLALSEATVSREWVALRAGGTSLLQWILAGTRAWMGVLLATLLLQIAIAPTVISKADKLYNQILNRSSKHTYTKPWLYLGSTGVLWYLEGANRWGFPLQPAGKAPIFLHWKMHDDRSAALPWNALHWQRGPEASKLFPDQALRDTPKAEEASTRDLVRWQHWAPDPERSAMLWGRLLNWLAGPCLVFAVLAHAFPRPRTGRGQALGVSLIVGLLFMGAQALFGGAAKAGEIPGYWGVVAPLAGLLGFGLLGLRRLRT